MLCACACVHVEYIRLCPCCLRALVFMLYVHDSINIVDRVVYLSLRVPMVSACAYQMQFVWGMCVCVAYVCL